MMIDCGGRAALSLRARPCPPRAACTYTTLAARTSLLTNKPNMVAAGELFTIAEQKPHSSVAEAAACCQRAGSELCEPLLHLCCRRAELFNNV